MGRKKSKKVDFQKVKLKVGRSLPKGLNVTQTKFKVQKIKIGLREQYRPETSDPRIQSHQKLLELVKKTRHTNVGVRHEAFLGIGKLLNSEDLTSTRKKELLELLLSDLLQVSAAGFSDEASSVRKEAINVWGFILENVPELKISAFSTALIPRLCLAMTNIRHAVRIDSLKVLEMCLVAIPSVITSSEKILQNFASQIVFDKNNIVYNQSGFKVSPMKTPSERVKLHHWRADVLRILAEYLKAVIHELTKKREEYFWPTFYSFIKIPGMGCTKIPEFEDLQSYFTSLMPILFDIWIEAAPIPYTKSDSGEVVSAEAAKVMDTVLQVIRLICEWINIIDEKKKNKDMINWFNSEYRKRIFGRVMLWFPYSQRASSGKRKLGGEVSSCLTVNLAICHIFSMMPPATSSSSTKLYQQINDYLLHLINSESTGGVASVSIIQILKNFLSFSKIKNYEAHLSGLLKRCKESRQGQKERRVFLDFMIDLIMDFGNKETLENIPMMKYFTQSLLQDLCNMHQNEAVEEHTLSVIKQVNAIAFPPFVSELQENSRILLELIKSKEKEIRTTAVYLVTRLTHIPIEFFHDLAKAIFDSHVPVKTVNSLIGFLSHGLRYPLHIPAFTGKDYANFLFCLAVGMFKHETGEYMALAQAEQDKHRDTIPFDYSEFLISSSRHLQYHYNIAQAAIQALMGFSDQKQMAQCIHNFVMQFTTQCVAFPVHTAVALLLLECEAYKIGCEPDDNDLLHCIIEIVVACFFYEDAWERGKEPEEIKPGAITGFLLHTVKELKVMGHVCDFINDRLTGIENRAQIKCIGHLLLVGLRKELILKDDALKVIHVVEKIIQMFEIDIQQERWCMAVSEELHIQFGSD